MNQPMQPIFILPEDTQRTSGKTAQRANITAAKEVGEMVRTTLGPKGMDKMIVNAQGEIIVTNDGVTILKEASIDHPTAKMIIEISKTQEEEVGDGTTTAVVLAAELLKKAEELLDSNIHPTIIAKAYRQAADQALCFLHDNAIKINSLNHDLLTRVAMTAMTGKASENHKEFLAKLVMEGFNTIGFDKATRESIKIQLRVGNNTDNSEIIKGVIIDKDRMDDQMPSEIKDAKILLLDCPLEVKNTQTETKFQITDPKKFQDLMRMEEEQISTMVQKIKDTGANAVFTNKGIDDAAASQLANHNIMAYRRIKREDLQSLSKATGAKITNINSIPNPQYLGNCGLIKIIKDLTIISECKNPRIITILLKGSSDHVLQETKRALEDAIGDIIASLETQLILSGAGACEIELTRRLQEYANTLTGREQLAVQAFAHAIEIIPRTLIENAGLDPIDLMTELKAAHQNGMRHTGINVHTGKTMNALEEGILEPLKIKTQAINNATEVACTILRIDDMITGTKKNNMPEQSPPY